MNPAISVIIDDNNNNNNNNKCSHQLLASIYADDLDREKVSTLMTGRVV